MNKNPWKMNKYPINMNKYHSKMNKYHRKMNKYKINNVDKWKNWHTHPKWKLNTFIMGLTIHEKKHLYLPNVGSEIQPCVVMLNFISLGVSL